MKIFYSPRYTIATHSFETTRKSRWIAESLAREPIAGIELVAPKPEKKDFLRAQPTKAMNNWDL